MASHVTARFSRIGCVVMAAGDGTRFGATDNKLLAPIRGKPLLQHAVDAVCGSDALSCTLVLGHDAEVVLAGIDTRRCSVMRNERWQEGIASSLRCGLQPHVKDDACIFLVGDQPSIVAADLNNLISARGARSSIIALRAGRTWGTPILFPREDFPSLLDLVGDRGAKRYAATQKKRVRFVDAASPAAFVDVDTRKDLKRYAVRANVVRELRSRVRRATKVPRLHRGLTRD